MAPAAAPDGGGSAAAPAREAGAEAITVCVRLRPLNELELYRQRDTAVWHAAPDGRTLRFDGAPVATRAGAPSAYAFDAVFGPAVGNEAVYGRAASPLVRSAMAGVNATLFAYGQSGSGKTHTIKAVLEAASAEVFEVIKATPGREYLLRLSAIEIYNEARCARRNA
jgi:centromeric protein E